MPDIARWMPDLGSWLNVVDSWGPAEWSAAASVGTLAIAVIAAVVALVQYRSSRAFNRQAHQAALEQTRLTDEANRQAATAATEQSLLAVRLAQEEARPYVVVYMEPARDGDAQVIDLVVRNFGKTAAHGVRVSIDPAPKRSIAKEGDDDRLVWLPDVIPTLVPGQEWRTLFDMGMHRIESNLPDVHRVTVEALDSSGHPLPPLESTLDWGQYKGQMWTTVRTMHDAATALRGIEKHVRGWREGASGGLAVTVRDGNAKDARRREEREKRLLERETGIQTGPSEDQPESAEEGDTPGSSA